MSLSYEADVPLKGLLAYDEKQTGTRPAVLVVHDWGGCNDFATLKAQKVAELGYLAFAVDMYGHGKTAQTKEDKLTLMHPLLDDRVKLQQRIVAAYTFLKSLDNVDPNNIGAIGFCFGGLCVLDLIRTGAPIKGGVSFHGLLRSPQPDFKYPSSISAKVLALHGYGDPMVSPQQVMNFADEMEKLKVDWQIHMYGNTLHAFSNPAANDPSIGAIYNQTADKRSWIAMKNFLTEIFATHKNE